MNKKRNFTFICLIVSIIILNSLFLVNSDYAATGFNNSSTISQNEIIKSSKSLYNYINKNEKLPETIKILNKNFSTEQFLYLMSKTMVNKKDKKLKNNITIKYNINQAKKPSGSNIKGTIYFKDIYNYSKTIIKYINSNSRCPDYIKTKLGNMQYESMIYAFSKFLSKTDSNGELTNKIKYTCTKKSPINNKGYTLTLFSKYKNGDSIGKYLISTKNAPSKKNYIRRLANQITKNCNTHLSKAESIFDWVKKNIKYSRYRNTKYGGEQTIKKLRGNCVDTSHALVSLLRAADIPARYVNGNCEFTKGDLARVNVAHVWVQVLVNNKWMVADGIYKGNRLGYVTNWKIDSYNYYGVYSVL